MNERDRPFLAAAIALRMPDWALSGGVVLTTLWRSLAMNPVIRVAILLQLSSAVLSMLPLMFDRRQLLGLNVWIKPVKFNVSIAVVMVTASVFLNGMQGCDVARLWVGSSLAIALGIESALITLQAARGVRSHLNVATSFDAKVSMAMGLMAVVATLAAAAILVLTFIASPRWPPALLWGVRLGLLMFLAGSFEGTLMFRHGGHTIGAPDGSLGVPVLNWSRKHGDLRVAHFFALHALQAFPIFGFLSSRTHCSEHVQVATVLCLSLLYTAGVWVLFRQAMQGRPITFQPDLWRTN